MLSEKTWIAAILAAAAIACGGAEAPPETTEAAAEPDTGAGSILRVDPRLDALVPADARI